ncbi:hypothetical protein BCAR13_1470010 [Paraburkholderia caribensis]|nr:hypothetical protein BCAR13_1470010 [Paraburkholderia caribensis]
MLCHPVSKEWASVRDELHDDVRELAEQCLTACEANGSKRPTHLKRRMYLAFVRGVPVRNRQRLKQYE